MLLSNVLCVMSRLLRKSKEILTDYNFISLVSSLDVSNWVCHAAVSCKARMQYCSLLVGHQAFLQRLAWRVTLDYLQLMFRCSIRTHLVVVAISELMKHRQRLCTNQEVRRVRGLSVQSKHSIQPFAGTVSIKDILFIAHVSSNTPYLVPESKNTSTHQRQRKNETTNMAVLR